MAFVRIAMALRSGVRSASKLLRAPFQPTLYKSGIAVSTIAGGTFVLSRGTPDEDAEMMKMYEEWMVKHNRVYNDPGEKERRFKIFKKTVERVNAHNSVEGRTYDLGVNMFADMTHEEVTAKYTGRGPSRKKL